MRHFSQMAHALSYPRGLSSALTAASLMLACGTGQHTSVPFDTERDAGADAAYGTQVASAVNLCPEFVGSLVTPQRITPQESALIAVTASDPDAPSSELVFSWSATSGTFSASDESVTNYTCAKLGTQTLTVIAKDRPGCTVALTINVDCVAN